MDDARVTTARADEEGVFHLTLDDGRIVGAHRLVLATGVRDVFPDVKNFKRTSDVRSSPVPVVTDTRPKVKSSRSRDGPEMATFAVGLLDSARWVTLVTAHSEVGALQLPSSTVPRLPLWWGV